MIQFFRRHGFVYDQLPAILWALAIFVASSIQDITIPDLGFVASDKVVHLVIYLVLCGLIYRALKYQGKFHHLSQWSLVFSWVLTVAFGVTDELHQLFVTNRNASVYDLVADAVGAALFVFFVLIRQRVKRDPAV